MKRSRIAPISRKRRQRDAAYPKARMAVYDRSQGLCEARTDVCTGRMQAVHHIAGRGGPDPHRLDNLLGCCDPCHRRIHSSPAESYEQGWMRRRVA